MADGSFARHFGDSFELTVWIDQAMLTTSWTTVRGESERHMPLYLDVHQKIEGLTKEAVAHAHQRDLEVQEQHGVKYLRYWYDEATGKVFCLVEAPSKEAAEAVHREAHGLVADELHEVKEGA
jgi:hypothetical protein